MKKFSVALITIFALAFSIAVVGAQDIEGTADDVTIGSFAMTDLAGSFAATADGMTLTLSDVAETVDYILTVPSLYANRYETVNLAGDWAAAPDALVAEAVLLLDDLSITLTLSEPAFVNGDLTFAVEIVEFSSDDASFMKAPFAPDMFAGGSLMIAFDAAFADGIEAGMAARLADVRASNVEDCFRKC